MNKKFYTVEETVELELNMPHVLQIHRYNKSDDQCVTIEGHKKDQYVIIDNVIIDGIDVQNLIWSRGWYEPEYPVLWASEQAQAGIELETKVLGETWLAHNGIWNFVFSSPFYKFVISQFEN